jgi:hypothetical protein
MAAIGNGKRTLASLPRQAAPHSKPPGHPRRLRPAADRRYWENRRLQVGHQPWCQQIFRRLVRPRPTEALPAARPPSPPTPLLRSP